MATGKIDIAKFLRRESRKVRLPQGGRHGPKRGAKGVIPRKRKHKNKDYI